MKILLKKYEDQLGDENLSGLPTETTAVHEIIIERGGEPSHIPTSQLSLDKHKSGREYVDYLTESKKIRPGRSQIRVPLLSQKRKMFPDMSHSVVDYKT